ncbi:ABC transporter substrate-binding protein [Xanthobacter autotrophicus]|uniref:ABC transporter substrate-binding protein n=1 Tax=Xanthobacter autotrophicus TaxID=280 RepID=UPI00372933D1
MLNRRDILRLTAAGASLAFMPIARAADGTPVRGGHLVSIVVPEPQNLGIAVSNPTIVIAANIFDGLVTYDAASQPRPQLAESWEQSADGRTITFRLRKGVKWHDGTPFSSADVKYSILEVVKKTHPRGIGTYRHLEDIETPDDHTAIFKLALPSPVIWSGLSSNETQILPKHLYEGTDPLTNPFNTKPIGTGPFVFKEWVRGSHVTLEHNPDYWDAGKPYLDKITFKVVPDAGARAAALETGEVQYIPLSPVPLSDVARLARQPGITVETRGWEAVAPIYFFDFNLRRKPFQDVRVRRAIAHAIDRRALAQTVWYDFAVPATSSVPSSQKQFHAPGLPQYEYDPKKAEALLDEAGLKRGADGVRLRFNHLNIPYGDDYKRSGEFIRQQLKRIGIEVELVNYDLPTFLRKVYTDYDFDTQSVFYAALSDPQLGVQRRFWTKAIQPGSAWSNASGYSNPEFDAVVAEAAVEPDVEKRRALLARFQLIAQTDLPSISLLELKPFRVWSSSLKGVDVSPVGVYASLGSAWLAPSGGKG